MRRIQRYHWIHVCSNRVLLYAHSRALRIRRRFGFRRSHIIMKLHLIHVDERWFLSIHSIDKRIDLRSLHLLWQPGFLGIGQSSAELAESAERVCAFPTKEERPLHVKRKRSYSYNTVQFSWPQTCLCVPRSVQELGALWVWADGRGGKKLAIRYLCAGTRLFTVLGWP